MNWTIWGAQGFIGSYLVSYLRAKDYEVNVVARDFDAGTKNLGHLVYCAGLTADFRTRPFDTVEAHVSLPSKLLQTAVFDSFLYLSSTRVYQRCSLTEENAELLVTPENSSDLYNISKIMGESICLRSGRKQVRIVRLSNILGHFPKSKNFIESLVDEALSTKKLHLKSTQNSSKDYLFIHDTLPLLEKISLGGRYDIYNIASGKNVNNLQIVDLIKGIIPCEITWEKGASELIFPPIDNRRITEEFAFVPSPFESNFLELINKFIASGNFATLH